MKKRIVVAIWINSAFIAVGVLLFIAGIMKGGQLLLPLGAGCICPGVVKTVRLINVLQHGEEGVKKYSSQFDERNTMISARAGDLTFRLFCLTAFFVVAVLAIAGIEDIAMIIAYVVCGFLIINLFSYWYYAKKY